MALRNRTVKRKLLRLAKKNRVEVADLKDVIGEVLESCSTPRQLRKYCRRKLAGYTQDP
jgi:hypothetical protein